MATVLCCIAAIYETCGDRGRYELVDGQHTAHMRGCAGANSWHIWAGMSHVTCVLNTTAGLSVTALILWDGQCEDKMPDVQKKQSKVRMHGRSDTYVCAMDTDRGAHGLVLPVGVMPFVL